MIIFYHKKTREIFGTIEGRVHDQLELTKVSIRPDLVDPKDVGKYVVPFKPNYAMVEKPKIEYVLPDKTKPIIKQVVVGTKKVKEVDGLTPDVSFADKIKEFEKNPPEIYKYKVKLNKKGEVTGFEKKPEVVQ